jgi:PAS domain S-box-containing protein
MVEPETVSTRPDPPSTSVEKRHAFRAALTELAQLDKSDLDAALRTLVAVDAASMKVARVSYWELLPDASAIRCRMLYQTETKTFESGALLRAADYPGYFAAMLECRAIIAPHAWTDPRTREFVETYFKPVNIRSMLDVPVWRQGRLAGVLCHEHVGDESRAWLPEEHDFALGIANFASVALEAFERQRAEESYALFARATNDVLWDWDLVTDTVEWNDAIHTVFRHRPEEVVRAGHWWVSRLHADDRARVKASLTRLMQSRESSWSEQYRWLRGDGTVAIVIDRGLAVRDDQGNVIRMVGTLLDITERMQMQERLALSDRMASIGTLAAGVAHEINNPLTYIKGNLTYAIEELRAGGNINVSNILELLRDAQEGAERVRRVVRDLQTLSRPQEEELETVDVTTVIESSLSMAWNELRHRAVVIRDFAPAPHVCMNRARLGQVILNLLINAAHAIQEGAVDTNRVHIRTATSAQGEAVIEIRDTGCGIPPDAMGRIFEPFFTTKALGDGTGLGLSICHSIVTAAGGRIDLTSPPTGGTCVTVVLPPGERVVEQPSGGTHVERRRILLVDDEAPVRRVLGRVLERSHEVVVTDSGAAALAMLERDARFDVILCDIMMPHMSGMQFYAQLAKTDAALAGRMIFMSGGAFGKHSADLLAACNQPVLDKPFDMAELQRALSQLDVAA